MDSGATFSLVPARILLGLGVRPYRTEVCEMADGSSIELAIGAATFTTLGITVTGEVLFGPDDAEPLLGALTIQAANLVWDARRERLVPSSRPHLLKAAATRSAAARAA